MTYTKNHQFAITCGGDNQIRVWDYYLRNTGFGVEPSQKIVGHSTPIFCLAISSDSKKVFTAGGQEGIYVWNFLGDVDTQIDSEQVLEFLSHNKQSKSDSKRLDQNSEENQRLRMPSKVTEQPQEEIPDPELIINNDKHLIVNPSSS